MTVVEAASQGAPTLVQGGGHVGATDLLCAESGEVLCCDMDQPADKVGAWVVMQHVQCVAEGLCIAAQMLDFAAGRLDGVIMQSWARVVCAAPPNHACYTCHPSPPQLADLLEALLADRASLGAVGRKALAKARSWTEHDNAAALVGYVQQALAAAAGSGAQ